jgi:tetratricopeptide (TPR) repeat protein
VINEFQRMFGNIVVNVDQAERRVFLEAILDSEPNRLGVPFRKMLFRQTRGHPLFTIELLRGMQERGDMVLDQGDRWVEGPALDWETLPARVEAVIAERIGRLAQPLRAALRVASVEGDIFTAEVVARIRAADEREMLGCLSRELDRQHRLIRAHSIQRMDGQLLSYYRFRHTLFQKYLYSSLDEVERVHLHEQVGTVLEDLYGDQQESAAHADIAPQLARHFQEARITEKAIHYLHKAGERAVQLSAYQEGIAHLTRGLALLKTLPDSPECAEQELGLRLALGMAWRGDVGFPDKKVQNAYTRARELCLQLGKTFQLCQVVGELAVLHYVLAEHDKALQLAEEALSLAQQADEPLLVASGNWLMGFILFCLGKFAEAREHLGQMIAFYNPKEHHRSLVSYRGSDGGTSALSYDACCLWCLGYPDQALSRSQESLVLARGLGHPFSLADVLSFSGCVLNELRREWPALKDNAEELLRLSNEKSLRGWLTTATRYHGEALAMLGQVQEGIAQIQEGVDASQSVGTRLYLSGTFGILAEVKARDGQIEEGLEMLSKVMTLIEETNERIWEAELYRLRGELHLMQGDDNEAEASFEKAIEVARRQSAKSWELRAATSLARLWQKQGKSDEAQKLLAPIYDWFSEGFDTPDLREARALLEEIS